LPELIAGAPVGVSEIMNLTKHAGDSGNLLTALICFYIWKKNLHNSSFGIQKSKCGIRMTAALSIVMINHKKAFFGKRSMEIEYSF
jgi:hypothetical protein